ncbi:MAG: MBL fold metallo-hydrolase [Candidatus Hodarchaeaceae archaeon]|nr:MBL fold metallo-hydrolase [Candidatus Hodarchaeaceae archaeon]
MTTLTFYGGVNEIGGNKILLEDRDIKLLLDFGLNFARMGKYYAEFLQPRTSSGLNDYLEFELVPRLGGLYREDLLKPTGMAYVEPSIHGVLLSHPHLDHAGCIPFLDWRVPVYCTDAARRIIKAYQESSRGGFDSEYCYGKVRPFGEYVSPNKWEEFEREFRSPEEAGLEVRSFEVDHSTLGACGCLIHASEGTIAYTGDLRLHGPRAGLTREFIRSVSEEDIDVLIIEGTRVEEGEEDQLIERLLGRPQPKLESEEEVGRRSLEAVGAAAGQPVFVDFPPRDFDRLRTFCEVASMAGRRLALPTKLAYYVRELSDIIGIGLDEFVVYVGQRELGSYDEREYHKWERELLALEDSRRCDWIREHMDELIIYMDFYSLQNLVDLKPRRGVYIHAASEPITEEQAIDFRRFKSWLEHFNLSYRYFHSSGHLSRDEVFEVIGQVDPKRVIPVHTRGSEIFAREVQNAMVPEEGVAYSLP